MSAFVYYLPGADNADEKTTRALGLAHAFDGLRKPVTCGCHKGPDGGKGVVASPDPERIDAKDVGHYPERQTWLAWPDETTARYWLGWLTDSPPTPDDLAREELLGKYMPILGDGNHWTVPTARLYPEGTMLPQKRTLLPDGTVRRKVKRAYRALYLVADEVWAAAESGEPIGEARQLEVCAAALGINYRVSHAEMEALELLDERSVLLVCWALVDWLAWPQNAELMEA